MEIQKKSFVFRVTSLRLCAIAVAASKASIAGKGGDFNFPCDLPHSSATSRLTGKILSSKKLGKSSINKLSSTH